MVIYRRGLVCFAMETEVREQSTKDGFAITEMQFTAIVNMVARHETELNSVKRLLHNLIGMRLERTA